MKKLKKRENQKKMNRIGVEAKRIRKSRAEEKCIFISLEIVVGTEKWKKNKIKNNENVQIRTEPSSTKRKKNMEQMRGRQQKIKWENKVEETE